MAFCLDPSHANRGNHDEFNALQCGAFAVVFNFVSAVLLHGIPIVCTAHCSGHATRSAGTAVCSTRVVNDLSRLMRSQYAHPYHILNLQVRNLLYLSWFYSNNFFFYALTLVSGCTILFLCAKPKDKPAIDDDDD